MEEWIRLSEEELDELNPGTSESGQGVDVHLFMSPYDLPDAVRGRYDHDRDLFVIEFRYMGDEPRRSRQHDKHVTLQVGKHSQRLYAIELDVKKLQAESVQLKVIMPDLVTKAIDDFQKSPRRSRRYDNYRVARDVISSKRASLFEPLAAVH